MLCVKCCLYAFMKVPMNARMGVCEYCWRRGAETAYKRHVKRCKSGCNVRHNAYVASCDTGHMLLDVFFKTITR